MSTASPTDQDLEFLRRPLHGFLTVAGGPVPPQPRPVWFEVTGSGAVQLFTAPDSVKVRRLRRDPRASLVVAAPVGEREHWVSVAGRARVEPDGGHDLCARLGARYWDLDDPARAAELAAMLDQRWVRVVIEPDAVSRFAG
ncbi:pyridoxamine 5'-phosphate oxidase family protein [Pseudonocardia lacus]|uniref:pyridoxamine 5'-phosphate oxidase family protein n=1 Tax=Pseudonocardia lacus TaxID=2835865 RepID=UPI001BDC1E20|nr:pyridoxamine 5'-phosphate oxidase family protein [Pseudonocardia lacus]